VGRTIDEMNRMIIKYRTIPVTCFAWPCEDPLKTKHAKAILRFDVAKGPGFAPGSRLVPREKLLVPLAALSKPLLPSCEGASCGSAKNVRESTRMEEALERTPKSSISESSRLSIFEASQNQ